MPRTLLQSQRNDLESLNPENVLICFMEITHESLPEPIRVCSDVVDYVYEGNTFIGFPFEFEILNDTDNLPQGKINIQNVDRRIGESILPLRSSVQVRLILMMDDDWGAAAVVSGRKVRSPTGTPSVILEVSGLLLRDVVGDDLLISATLADWDYTSEPWPRSRATKDTTPALFWN